MSNLEGSAKSFVSDPIGYTTGKIVGEPQVGQLEKFQPLGFAGGGLTGKVTDGTFELSRTPELQSQIGGLQSALSKRALEFANLRKGLTKDISPIIGGLRTAGVEAIRGRRRRTIGDLRENLQRRRVAGSSFGADALSRAEAEFAKEEAEFGAEVGVKEFEMEQQLLERNMQLLDQETQANIESFNVGLTQSNLEAGLAAQISTAYSGIAAENARAISDIMAQYAAARANIVGSIAGAATTGAIAKSDRRVKKDIERIDKIGPFPVYKFKYLWDEEEQIGFMAQDVEEIYPEAVIEINGIKHINYTTLRKKLCH
jgi:hypothetical protein